MKYTDGLFSLPVRIYDAASLKRVRRLEEDADISVQEDGDWVEGTARIPFDNIKGLIDYFSKALTPEEVAKQGFDCCVVLTQDYGDFMCNRPRKWVEDKLNEFSEKYINKVEEFVEREMEKKEHQMPVRKLNWWQRFWKKSA